MKLDKVKLIVLLIAVTSKNLKYELIFFFTHFFIYNVLPYVLFHNLMSPVLYFNAEIVQTKPEILKILNMHHT